jgi:16S rRNA C1402 (ribose-2'-O) methylase RsmI
VIHLIVCLDKETSKSFETIKTATLPSLNEYLSTAQGQQKGEFVILVSGVDKNNINMYSGSLPPMCKPDIGDDSKGSTHRVDQTVDMGIV